MFCLYKVPHFVVCAVLRCSVVSDSLWPHGFKSARLLCPWGFSKQGYWSGLVCPPPGDLPNAGNEPTSLTVLNTFSYIPFINYLLWSVCSSLLHISLLGCLWIFLYSLLEFFIWNVCHLYIYVSNIISYTKAFNKKKFK